MALPIALAVEVEAHGLISQARLYHSLHPVLGHHEVREPILFADPHPDLDGPVAAYHTALTTGDVDGAVSAFAEDGYVREPAGNDHVHRGTVALRALYGALLDRGGLSIEACRVTDDGVRTVLEYRLARWGGTRIPAQAGLAVYERDTDRLVAARLYDDVATPD